MDRFIVAKILIDMTDEENLKSNMDRFIVLKNRVFDVFSVDLKSNMDRFIVGYIQCKSRMAKNI